MTGHTNLPITTAATDLAPDDQREAIEEAAELALDQGRTAVVVGATDTKFLVCTAGCCLETSGAFIVVPDVRVVEIMANGPVDLGRHFRVMRVTDRRVCVVYVTGRAVTS